MSSLDISQIAPESIILPSIPVASQLASANIGTIGMSGANLMFFNGSAWKRVTAS